MLASATLALPVETACDTVAVGLFEGKGIPHDVDGAMQALVEGTALSAYRFDRYKSPSSEERPSIAELVIAAHEDHSDAVQRALVVSEAVNHARDLQNTP